MNETTEDNKRKCLVIDETKYFVDGDVYSVKLEILFSPREWLKFEASTVYRDLMRFQVNP